MKNNLILGIDPGSNITGYAILDIFDLELKDWGIIKTPQGKLHRKIYIVGSSIEDLILKFNPSVIAIESQFVGKFPSASMPICQIKGAIIFIAYKNKLEVFEYSSTHCKKSITGNGSSSKATVVKFCSVRFGMDISDLEDNCADAIAVALSHAKSGIF